MSTRKYLAIGATLIPLLAAQGAWAGMVTDAHGNVGYDTAAECDAAVNAGTAKFYKPFTHHAASLRAGEKRVQVMTLKEILIPSDAVKSMNYQTNDYKRGACDLGVGAQSGQHGVTKPLIGKYIPYSADMPVNVYFNKSGVPVRAAVKQCNNRFAAMLPRPVPAAPVAIPATTPPASTAIVTPAPTITPSVQPVAPVPTAPAPVQAAPVQAVRESAFGSIGYKEVLGAGALLAVGAILVHNHGDSGTTGTTGTK